MPNTPKGGGISRKIFNPSDRKKIRTILNDIEIPKEMGLIVRTAGEGKDLEDLKWDLEYLQRVWEGISEANTLKNSPILISIFVLQNCTIPESRKPYCPESGCLLEKRENPNERYVNEGQKLETNGEFESLEVLDEFPYPPETPSFIKEGEMPRPKKIFSSTGSENVEVRRLGEIYWIYVEALPSKAWPLIKDFFADEEYNLVNDDPSLGQITAEKNEKLFLTLEHGIKNNSSEIYLLNESNTSLELAYFEDLASYTVSYTHLTLPTKA